jgi:hypothetical protein
MPSARIICPNCSAKLRISTTGGVPTRAKCHTCHKTFTPTFTQPVEGAALYLDALTSAAPLAPLGPLPAPVPPPPPEPLPPMAARPTARPAQPAATAAPIIAPPPQAASSEQVDPPARAYQMPRPEPAGGVAIAEPRTSIRPPAALSEPPPPVAGPRHRGRDHVDPFQAPRLKPYEIGLALALIAACVIGLVMLWFQYYPTTKSPQAVAEADVPEETTPLANAFTGPSEQDKAPKPLPTQLAGQWELRSDDGRSGMLTLSPDGRLAAASSAGEKDLPNYEGQWALISQDGNQYVLEFGKSVRGLESYRVKVELTQPNAFTLLETIKNGVRLRETHRFIRTGPAPADDVRAK